MEHTQRRFNLVEEAWIPVADHGLVSLRDIFSNPGLRALGGNPIQKISVTKLLLAIAQAAHTPKDMEEWQALGADGIAKKALDYLNHKKDCFWLYGDRPFMQMPGISEAAIQPFAAIIPDQASGNTTVVFQSQLKQEMTDSTKALQVLVNVNCALSGKQTDNSIVLTSGYAGKTNPKGKPSSGKSGSALGFLGYLHSFVIGENLQQTLWLNLLLRDDLADLKFYTQQLGSPPWEKMPQGEDDATARMLKDSYIGRLVPLSRFVLLAKDGLHYSEGIQYPTHKEGASDLSVTLDPVGLKAIWTDPGKRPWRQLTALLAFLDAQNSSPFDCPQLRIGIQRAKSLLPQLGVWSGGLRVSSNAGEQYTSGSDDFVESEVHVETESLGDWFLLFSAEMGALDQMAKIVFASVAGYFKSLKTDGGKHAAAASNLFWQLAEQNSQDLVDACGDPSGVQAEAMRRLFIGYANRAYDAYAPRDSARQLEAWAANRPKLGRFYPPKQKEQETA